MKIISGTKDFLRLSSFNSVLKCTADADAVGYSLIISLPVVISLTRLTFLSYRSLGSCIKSSIDTFNKFASIRSAIFSSAISMVMYSTFLPCDIAPAATWHIKRDLPTPVPANAILRVFLGKPPLVILLK